MSNKTTYKKEISEEDLRSYIANLWNELLEGAYDDYASYAANLLFGTPEIMDELGLYYEDKWFEEEDDMENEEG